MHRHDKCSFCCVMMTENKVWDFVVNIRHVAINESAPENCGYILQERALQYSTLLKCLINGDLAIDVHTNKQITYEV